MHEMRSITYDKVSVSVNSPRTICGLNIKGLGIKVTEKSGVNASSLLTGKTYLYVQPSTTFFTGKTKTV